ncbi:MAG TPA: extensin family protein [Pseudolabrys sp.]|nr:extensin family protein [Pseudolabrys sp.]
MRRRLAFSIAGGVVLLALAGCGRSYLMQGERAAWRHEAEETCMKSGTVTVGTVQIEPIEGPGMCGMDFPLRVSALAESAPAMSYGDDLRPPASVPNGADMPQWPPGQRYVPPARVPAVQSAPVAPVQAVPSAPVRGETLRWVPGPPGVDIERHGNAPPGEPMPLSPAGEQATVPPYRGAPQYVAPRGSAPQSLPQNAAPRAYPSAAPAARALPDDIPDDAQVPPGGSAGAPLRRQPAYDAPTYQPPPREPPRLGPMRGPNLAALQPAALQPPATLACPLVSALDRWVSEGVQPAALHWFGSPVTSIHQIGGYSCRGMVGGDGVSEHSFGNALDVAGFTLANGRKITVKDGWHGAPEEQGFLHDVQLYACETFSTVLAPGYNVYHYDHIHVDLMRRDSGSRPCRPNAIPGEVAAAKARAVYAARHRSPAYTGSIDGKTSEPVAVPGADGDVADPDAEQPKVAVPKYLGRAAKLPNEDRLAIH